MEGEKRLSPFPFFNAIFILFTRMDFYWAEKEKAEKKLSRIFLYLSYFFAT